MGVCPAILPHHLKAMHARGLDDETIRTAGIYSEADKTKLASILGHNALPVKCEAIVIPYSGIDGGQTDTRGSGRTTRGCWPKSRSSMNPRGIVETSVLPAWRARTAGDMGQDIIITEGRIQGPGINPERFCVHRIRGGVRLGREKSRVASSSWSASRGRGEASISRMTVTSPTNPMCRTQKPVLAAHLANRGAIVKVLRIPAGPPNAAGKATKLGLDDYLATQDDPKRAMTGIARQRRGSATAKGNRGTGEGKRNATRRARARHSLTSTKLDGVARLRFWRGHWHYWEGGAYRAHQEDEVRMSGWNRLLMKKFYGIAQSSYRERPGNGQNRR